MSDSPIDTTPSDVGPAPDGASHTEGGAPTNKAHEDAGDGSLSGAIPAGLTVDELLEQANSDKTDDGGTG